jgi:hypothetical protein
MINREVMNMYTAHAKKRCQQRAIPEQLCEIVLDYGRDRYDKRGGRVWFLTKRSLIEIERKLGAKCRKDLERKKGMYLVESVSDNAIITVGHAFRTKCGWRH